MKIHLLIIAVLAIVLVQSCKDKTTISEEKQLAKTEADQLHGLWKLESMEQKDSLGNWHEWRNGMQGYLLYDGNKSMALHLLKKDYEKTDLRFPNFTDTIPEAALKHLTGSYVYIGDYKILTHKSIVEHTRLSHSNPGEWGKTVQRRFSFSGDTLIIKPVEEKNASLRLKWLKKQ
ncbi:lipocalin-like domain-containing protein [Marixanthomonas spongiae]|uniref:Lipocalin-like domain-containing protein n=1 Tax=Marixanthomonas spongiae TaxID=2174845 RepID=A0A2U0HXI0_9FLAO|nr:lipocalin-like domain-containing protein [Marixanthomonas spongiae]PVW13529.1 hypothetical protein DDV96_12795 [Marixanthomonas spongiae]